MQFKNAPCQFACGVALLFASTSLVACGTTPLTVLIANPTLAIADTGNSRVLVYNTPLSDLGEAAVVLGQNDFTSSQEDNGKGVPTASNLNVPSSITKDSAGNLYVADSGNARVLIFRPPFASGMNASVVIGQPDFTSSNNFGGPDATATSLLDPTAVAIDGKGNLWVADVSNARVLEYTPPFHNGMAATLAIGQPTTGAATVCYETPPTATTLCYPLGIAFDPNGNLWVSDADSNRVLQYKPPFSTGMAASLELGQPPVTAFTSGSSPGPSAISLAAPVEVKFDPSGNLWVADSGFNRVLEFSPPFSNGMAASTVLGQADFTHGDMNRNDSNTPAADTMSHPTGLDFDNNGTLSASDDTNSRILRFASPFTTGMKATGLIGQPDFTTGSTNQGHGGGASAFTLQLPLSLSAF